MSQKYKCNDLWNLWGKGWMVVPSAPYNIDNLFPTKIGNHIISRFPRLEKNYHRICEADKGPYVLFRTTFNKNDPTKKILVYHDIREPLSPHDTGLIILPDMITTNNNTEEETKADWEVIEKSCNFIIQSRNIIPGPIFMPPLGYGQDRLSEIDAVDDLMALLIDVQDVFILYDIIIQENNTQEDTDNNDIDNSKPTDNQEGEMEEVDNESSLIQNEFETIEVNL